MKTDCGLRGRSILTLHDISDKELDALLELAAQLKKKKKEGIRGDLLDRRKIALLFEKLSTRTRCSASVAAADEGGHCEFLAAYEIHLGKKESVADTARVLGRLFDGIFYRGFLQATIETLAAHAGVPVWNALTDDAHPTQVLADLLTVRERFGELRGLKLVYMGDGRNNMANSLMVGCAKSGMHFVNCTPPALMPDPRLVEHARGIAEPNGGSVSLAEDPQAAVRDAAVVYTDVWVSMGEEDQAEERRRLLAPYQVNMAVMEATGRLARDESIFLHCLPAFHDHNTEATRESGALEVTNDVFEAPFSLVFDQAENRSHTIKAMFVATLT
jgi:ornithine carbamoyltransferase